jgi:hypothetical protein
VVKVQLQERHPCVQHTPVSTPWLQLQVQTACRQAFQPRHVLRQLVQSENRHTKATTVSWYVNAAHILAMRVEV